MKIKTKLTLGVGLLFILILILGIVGAYNINALKQDTEHILSDNYNSLLYCGKMLSAIETNSGEGISVFEENLLKQEKNNTEPGEAEATALVRSYFEKLKLDARDSIQQINIRTGIYQIMQLNMSAIEYKSNLARTTAAKAVLWIAVSGTLCFLIAFTLLINMPSSIANPIKELTESIKQIADKNYSKRVHFQSHGEFGQLAQSFNTMAEKLEEYNSSNLAKLLMGKNRIETLINNMTDAVIGLDEDQKILFINEQALKITGLKKEDVLGQSAQTIAINNDLIRSLIQDLIQKGYNSNTQQPLKIFADNKESFFNKKINLLSITHTAEMQSKQIGDVILLKNITPFKELYSAKTNFIATISHELKTPISSILMSLDLLENEKIGKVNNDQHQLIQSVRDDSSRLLKITSELLNMTQAESGKIQLTLHEVQPIEIVQYATEAVKIQADQKKIRIRTNCSPSLPAIKADREKTSWVLTNLLANAIHYSHENSEVQLTVKESSNLVQFSVQDFGQGIDLKYLPKLFDRYFQIPGSHKAGTGLGLAICKEFIEAQGGEISVESEIGKGSIFYIVLKKIL